MPVYEHPTIAERTQQLLNTTNRPLTAAIIAEQVGTTPRQARRALRLLETQNAATRQIAPGGRYEWRAASPSPQPSR